MPLSRTLLALAAGALCAPAAVHGATPDGAVVHRGGCAAPSLSSTAAAIGEDSAVCGKTRAAIVTVGVDGEFGFEGGAGIDVNGLVFALFGGLWKLLASLSSSFKNMASLLPLLLPFMFVVMWVRNAVTGNLRRWIIGEKWRQSGNGHANEIIVFVASMR